MDISSIPAHIDDLKTFLNLLNMNFNIICIYEGRLSTKTSFTININITCYNIEQRPTELSVGGTLMYISKKISYKLRRGKRTRVLAEVKNDVVNTISPICPIVELSGFNLTFQK